MKNPVIERELIGVLRSGKAVAMQLLPAVACALLVLLRWPSAGQVDLGGTQARQVFQLFGYGLLTAILLLVPAFPATSLVRERLRGTLALLLQTPMRPWSIYLGKLAGILGVAALPLAASIPAAAACYAMGGLSLRNEVLPLYAVLALATFQYAALGLFVSSRAASVDSALRATYGLVLVLAVLTLAPYQVLQGTSGGRVLLLLTWLRALSPLPAVMEILGHSGTGSQGLIAAAGNPLRYAIMALASTAVFAAATLSRLRPVRLERSRPQGKVTNEHGLGSARCGGYSSWWIPSDEPGRSAASPIRSWSRNFAPAALAARIGCCAWSLPAPWGRSPLLCSRHRQPWIGVPRPLVR